VTLGTSTGGSSTVRLDDHVAAVVVMGGHSTSVTSLAVYGSHDNAAYAAVYGADGSQATITVPRLSAVTTVADGTSTITVTNYTAVNMVAPLPDAAGGLRYMRLVADAAPGTAATVAVSLKS